MMDGGCARAFYQARVSVGVAVGILHVLDSCLQQCLCVKTHYGSLHDYIQ